MKRVLLTLFLLATGCAAAPIDAGGTLPPPKEYSSVVITIYSHTRRDSLLETLEKEFGQELKVQRELDIGLSALSSEESENRRMPVQIDGTIELVEKVVNRATEILGEQGYVIRPYPQNIYEIRLPDVLLSDPDKQWSISLAVRMAAQKVLASLAQKGLITYSSSGETATIYREEEKEFVFKKASECQAAFDAVSPLVKRSDGFVARQEKYLYCAGGMQFVKSVNDTIGRLSFDFRLRRYAFSSLRVRRIHDLLPPEDRELCKYIMCRSVEELDSPIEGVICWAPFVSRYDDPTQIDEFLLSLARYAIANETVNDWKGIKRALHLIDKYEQFVMIPCQGVLFAIKTVVQAKDRDSVPFLFSKALVASDTGIDYGDLCVEAIAEILCNDATWHLVAIAESLSASNETRRAALDCLRKIDTPEAKSAAAKLKPAIDALPEDGDPEEEDE
jgi:hypothetical protein